MTLMVITVSGSCVYGTFGRSRMASERRHPESALAPPSMNEVQVMTAAMFSAVSRPEAIR
jgi:hypothetical protein